MSDNINALLNVWVEVQITADGLNLALLSEKSGDGARVESVEHLSPEDLQLRDGETFTMNLGENTVENLSEMRKQANIGQMLQSEEDEPEQEENLPEVGEVVEDQNPPEWSQNGWLEVVEVLPHVRSDEYVIQGQNEGQVIPRPKQDWTDETVAAANPSYDEDEPVVMAQYEGTGDWYAFPASRLQ